MRAALEWLLERKKGKEALRLEAALGQFWSLSGNLSEGHNFLEEALGSRNRTRGKSHLQYKRGHSIIGVREEWLLICSEKTSSSTGRSQRTMILRAR